MEEKRCATVFPKPLPQLLYQCHCLEKAVGGGESERDVGRYEIFRDRRKQFRFRLKARNGETVLASEGYTTLSRCMRGAISVTQNGPKPDRFVGRTAKGGAARFVLSAANGRVIATSESYSSPKAMERGISAVRKASPTGRFVNQTW